MEQIILRQHNIAAFLQCRRKFDLQVNQGWRPRTFATYIDIGSLFDKSVAEYHRGKPVEECMIAIDQEYNEMLLNATTQEKIDDLENSKIITQGMIYGYCNNFYQINIEPHYKISVPIGKYGRKKHRLFCELDGLYRRGKENWIVEIKTATSIDKNYIKRLDTDFQMNCYFYALRKWLRKPIVGVLYRVVRKPSIRQKRNENIEQFRKRLMLEYVEKKDDYFYEEKIYKNQKALREFSDEIEQIFEDIKMAYKTKRWYRSGQKCAIYGECAYLKYCNDPTEETLETFYEKEE